MVNRMTNCQPSGATRRIFDKFFRISLVTQSSTVRLSAAYPYSSSVRQKTFGFSARPTTGWALILLITKQFLVYSSGSMGEKCPARELVSPSASEPSSGTAGVFG